MVRTSEGLRVNLTFRCEDLKKSNVNVKFELFIQDRQEVPYLIKLISAKLSEIGYIMISVRTG